MRFLFLFNINRKLLQFTAEIQLFGCLKTYMYRLSNIRTSDMVRGVKRISLATSARTNFRYYSLPLSGMHVAELCLEIFCHTLNHRKKVNRFH